MEEALLLNKKREGEKGGGRIKWEVIWQEVKNVSLIAGPMAAVVLSQYLLTVISTMMVGHLGELSLSSTALAISLASVSGFSFLLGMSSALETLCGQAYGAQQYWKLGTQTYTGILSLILVSIPLSALWIYMGKILTFIGQDPLISHEAGKFITYLLPALYAYAALQPLVRYFQSQSLIIPMLLCSWVILCLHVPLCWVLVFKSGLENLGAAVAIDISLWLNVIFLALVMKFSTVCAKTRSTLSMEVLLGIGEFFRFAVPSAAMICLEWWSFELMILLSGLLPNPELETSVLSICLTTIATLYAIPYGVGAAGSTRVSNELGAGNPEEARTATYAVLLIAITEATIVSTTLFIARRVLGYSFSNEKEVVDYVTNMAPLVCISIILDSIYGVLSGVARGCGWQHVGAVVNLGAFYLFGIPIAAVLGFWMQWRGRGIWIGIQLGASLQTALLSIITFCINWEKQATKARKRLFEGSFKIDNQVPSKIWDTIHDPGIPSVTQSVRQDLMKLEDTERPRRLKWHGKWMHCLMQPLNILLRQQQQQFQEICDSRDVGRKSTAPVGEATSALSCSSNSNSERVVPIDTFIVSTRILHSHEKPEPLYLSCINKDPSFP
ncbi:hypothetical protein Nepgr_022153 [Nepenthes gracilis]|uniref:Protein DETOXIFICATION n=1 Tax=Nepenthes gracilis TaxID=150966 RepID=A0AAD3T196_NEPGR|nr:hypothetical protein Nepgr_022153 [Nepenthes gracilis]